MRDSMLYSNIIFSSAKNVVLIESERVCHCVQSYVELYDTNVNSDITSNAAFKIRLTNVAF